MHFIIDISGNVLAGVLVGGATAAVVVAFLTIPLAFLDGVTSLGGGEDYFRLFLTGARWYVPLGALVGGIVAGLGSPWWTASIVVGGGIALLSLVWTLVQRAK